MKVKQTALFFVCLLSSQYSLGVAAKTGSCAKPSGCSKGCVVKPSLVKKLDKAFDNIRDNVPNSVQLKNATLEQNLQVSGTATGLKSFRAGNYRCECIGSSDSVRVTVDVSFLHVLLDFVVYILDDLLGGLLGPLGLALATILGDVVNLLVKLLGLNIECQVTVVQQFIPGTTADLESFTVTDVNDITLLGLNLFLVADLLSPILTPVVNLLMEIILEGPVKAAFEKELNKLVITKEDVTC